MATEIKPEKMWAIYNPSFGFYIGTWLSRQEAIHYHVENKTKNATWEFCKKRGDRCIRVEISAAQPRVQLTNGGRAKIEGGSKAAIRN
jgi:hypothetical protein